MKARHSKGTNQFTLLIPIALVLTACSSISQQEVENRINAWNGQPIDDLIKYWGLPNKKNQLDGKNYAEWVNTENKPGNTSVSLGTGRHGGHGSVGLGFTLFDLGGKEDHCSRLVTYAENGTVSNIRWQGTNDFCFDITPDRAKIEENKRKMALPANNELPESKRADKKPVPVNLESK